MMRGPVGSKLDLRQPWLWSALWQRLSFALAIVVGVLLLLPWWLRAWDAWTDAQQAAQAMARTQTDISHAQQSHTQLDQDVAQHRGETKAVMLALSVELPAVTQALTHLAERESLALSLVDWDVAVPVSTLKTTPMQQVPVHLQLHGAWPAWMRWWTQLPEVAPLATLSSLDLHAQPHGGWRAQVMLQIPQRITQGALDWQLAGVSVQALGDVDAFDPVDARAWQHTQSQYAQQHPSYARWVVPELRRTRTPLEALPRERLRYVGLISQAGVQQALLRWSEAVGAATHAPIYRVALGDYVGQDFGRVQTIAADKLTLRELVRDAQGVWQPRDVTLPLEDGAK